MIVELQEYEVRELDLNAEQAQVLRNIGAVSVQPAWSPGRYRVTAGSTVGALSLASEVELRIRPKLPVRRVVYLLCHAAGLATWDERLIDLDDDAPVDVAITQAFAAAATQALRRGARSDYYRVEDRLPELRGRLDTNDQRRRFGLPLPVSVSYDEYGIDIAENRLLLGATEVLRRLPNLPSALRKLLRRIAAECLGVRPATPRDAELPVRFNRLNEQYRPAVAVARAVLRGHGFELGHGASVVGFTVDMNRVFEAFLEVALRSALEGSFGGRVMGQRMDELDEAGAIRLKPDITWMLDNRPVAVIDAKYKTLSGVASEPDLYQAFAYATALGTRSAHLVHATDQSDLQPAAVRNTDISIVSTGLDLAAPLADLCIRIEQLAREIARSSEVGVGHGVQRV